MKFKVGDRVRINSKFMNGLINGKEGFIRAKEEYFFAVELDTMRVHTCDGLIPSGRGWWSLEDELELITNSTQQGGVTNMRKRYMLLKETDGLKKGAVVEEMCDDGNQDFKLLDMRFCKFNDTGDYTQGRKSVEENPTWWEEVVPVYAPKHLMSKVQQILGLKKAKRGRPKKYSPADTYGAGRFG